MVPMRPHALLDAAPMPTGECIFDDKNLDKVISEFLSKTCL